MTTLSDVKVSVYLPKRGKGHQEVLMQLEASTSTDIDAFEFIPDIMLCSYNSFTLDTLCAMGKEWKKKFKLNDISIAAAFLYTLNRVSPGFSPVFFQLPCRYTYVSNERGSSWRTSLTLPLSITSNKQVLAADLTVSFVKPKRVYIEDMVDKAYHSLGVKFYPVTSKEERDATVTIISESPLACLAKLKTSLNDARYCRGGTALISAYEAYEMYKSTYSTTWTSY